MNFYIADPHFGHAAIIRLCDRPFDGIEEMDESIIANWNRKVTNADTVYIVGDMMFRNVHLPGNYLSRLKGNKVLIMGNHDASWVRREDFSRYIKDQVSMMDLIDKNRKVVLCHYPMLVWPNMRRGGYMVYGHLHGQRDQDPCIRYGLNPRMLNACVEINGYQPVTLDELIENNRIFRENVLPTNNEGSGESGLCSI